MPTVAAQPDAGAQPDTGAQPDAGVAPVAGLATPPDGAVPSAAPGTVVTPDGWELTVAARDEVQVAVAPLTTALSSREYLVAGTFTGSVKGSGSEELSGGTLEVGYQIGCGISLNVVKLNGSVGLWPSLNAIGLLDSVRTPVTAQIEVFPQPGEVITVQLTQKDFTGTDPRVTVKDAHIKIDGCIGQSFLRSYAILTSSTDTADDIVAYYGVAKAV
ncbi:MspA family porin [Mycobacterium sp. SMC-4]|uniref:MspA family porin n=1 Tax=Mycobacterium sp. SMC-4 TaxID=2857059 RepID=UPI0021B37252|nr:MspA family porin [Mycobacterium sp. SMC-4]